MVLPDATLFPQSILPVRIDEPRHRRLLADVLDGPRMIFVTMRKPGALKECAEKVGGVGLVRACITRKNGSSDLLLEGLTRARLDKTLRYRPYRICRLSALPPRTLSPETVNSLLTTALELTCRLLVKTPLDRLVQIPVPQVTDRETLLVLQRAALDNLVEHLRPGTTPDDLVNLVSSCLLSNPGERQLILETQEVDLRLRRLIRILHRQIDAVLAGQPTAATETASSLEETVPFPRPPLAGDDEDEEEDDDIEPWEDDEDEQWEEPDFDEDEDFEDDDDFDEDDFDEDDEDEDWEDDEEDEEEEWDELTKDILAEFEQWLGDSDITPPRSETSDRDDNDEDIPF